VGHLRSENGSGVYIKLIIAVLAVATVATGLYIAFRPWPDIRVKSVESVDNISLNETENVWVTVVNDGDAFGSKRISLEVDNKEFMSHLFSIREDREEVMSSLNDEEVSEGLKNILDGEGISMSDDLEVFVNEEGDNWILHDREKGYNLVVVEKENRLDVLLDSRIVFLDVGEEKTIIFRLKLENRGTFTISSGNVSKKISVI